MFRNIPSWVVDWAKALGVLALAYAVFVMGALSVFAIGVLKGY